MSFDLKAAREICSRIKGYEDPDGGNFADFQAAEMLPAALDEIERLEAAYLKAQNSNLLRKQAYESLEKIANKQRAALKKLGTAKRERGKAMVEERARGNHYGMSYEDAAGGEIERWIIDGEIDAPKVYIERMRVEARSQLCWEGKL